VGCCVNSLGNGGSVNLEEIKKHIKNMKTESDEFYSLFDVFMDKYFDLDKEKLDMYMECKRMIYMWLTRSTNEFEDQVIVTAKVVENVFNMRLKKQPSCTGTLGFTDETFYFDIYTTENQRDKLGEILIKAKQSMESGNFTIKDNSKKNKYFNKVKK
jgi:hypothetical protein